MVVLIAPHGVFASLVPSSCRLAVEVVLVDQSFLDGLCPIRINFFLSTYASCSFLSRTRSCRFTWGCTGSGCCPCANLLLRRGTGRSCCFRRRRMCGSRLPRFSRPGRRGRRGCGRESTRHS